MFLIDRDRKHISERLYKRGLWDDASTYPDKLKPIELEWVILFNQYYEQEAAKHSFTAHDIAELATLKATLARAA